MPLFNYIRIALTEQNQQSPAVTLLDYTGHGTAFMDQAPLASTIFDFFLNARECYVQWTTRDFNHFALVFRNPYASDRSSFYMLTLAVESGAALTGRETLRALGALRRALVEERRTTTAAIDDALVAVGIPQEPRGFESWRIPPTYVRDAHAPACYRTYVSNLELETYLTFPIQEEYAKYSCVIYVAATTSLRPGVTLQHVLSPLRNVYTIVTPEGVESSRPSAAGGDRIILTFTRQGYSPIREAVIAGRPSAFVTYDGPRMIVKPQAECRLTFTRRIPLTVRSAKGGPVTGYTVTVNGRPVDTMQPYIEILDQDLASGQPVTITVNSNNFISEKIEMHPDQLDPSRPINVMLNPLEQGIILRLDFGEGRIFEQQISLEKNTPEYSQLHGGSFHGFRARRLTVPGGGEIYYIDVRSGAKPSAPAFDNVAADARPAAPQFDRSLPKVERPSDKSDLSDESDSSDESDNSDDSASSRRARRRARRRWRLFGLTAALVVLAAAICVGVFYFFPSWFSSAESAAEGNATSDTTTLVVRDTATVAIPASELATQPESAAAQPAASTAPAGAAAAPAAEEADDFAYLNANGRWRRDRLKSATGQALYDALVAGDIEKAVRNPYFYDGRATNSDAIHVADLIWSSYGASTQRSNEKVLHGLKNASDIDLHTLYESLARYRSPEPNPAKRPVRQ